MTLLQCSLVLVALLLGAGFTFHHFKRAASRREAAAADGCPSEPGPNTIEAALRELALDASTNAISIVDVSTGEPAFAYVNETFTAITGYDSKDVLGRHPRLLHRHDTHQAGLREMREAIQAGVPCSVRLRNYRQDGDMYWSELRVRPVRGAEGQVSHYIAVQSDVSQSVLAEQALQQRSDRLNAVFDLSPDGFVVLDEDDFVSLVNPAFERLTGLRAADLVGRHSQILEALLRQRCAPGPETAAAKKPAFVDTLPSGTDDKAADTTPPADVFKLLAPQSRILLRRIRHGAQGQGDTVISFRDITRESEMDRMKTEFLSTAAHELRTPMTSIFGFAELLLRHDFDESRRREIVTTIHRQTGLLVNLVNELLDLARIESRRGEALVKKLQPLLPIVEGAVAGVLGSSPRQNVRVVVTDEPVWVDVDSDKLSLALTNLLSNACKYSEDGTEVVIDFLDRARHGAHEVGVRISDRGIGMTEQELSRVFERFYRANPSGKVPGTGLGMAIAKEMVELQGGELALWSRPGSGTRVTVWLPVKPKPRHRSEATDRPIGLVFRSEQFDR